MAEYVLPVGGDRLGNRTVGWSWHLQTHGRARRCSAFVVFSLLVERPNRAVFMNQCLFAGSNLTKT